MTSHGSDRVQIETAVHEVYKQLTDNARRNVEEVPFLTMKDVFMWSVALGYASNTRKKLKKSRQQIFHWPQFDAYQDVPVLKAVALTAERDVNVLTSPERILRIVEEYANAGIHDLVARLDPDAGLPLNNLLHLARSAE
ncbi:hypothetical protein [Deinococcus yavapaiensis]|uniref:Dnd system-associated protein 4 n=1 Tax=Deinococcus yavapaiensis KR-236 TaxID=694435 RepID=A0A318SIT4_9DEIO|nr:hypothetical protein [Deinococcus yavapaiensis]PYE54095.1 dnd system-associated protein 4 [Deinococcus yavapaiensis KR-236]